MKKIISILLLIASILSFYIVYEAELNQYTNELNGIEMNLPNSYEIMVPVTIDNKDKDQIYESILKILNKYDGGIYYDRIYKDESKRIKYIYDKNNMYISNIELVDGERLTAEYMNTNKYLSTQKSENELQLGRIATFDKDLNEEIKTLKTMIEDGFNFSGSCYVAFKNNINIEDFITEVETAFGTKGISIIDKQPIKIEESGNYKVVLIIIYFIVMILILYKLLSSYKKIGVKKLLGYSVKQIYVEDMIELIKTNLTIGMMTIIPICFMLFNQLNGYVYKFILKLLFGIGIQNLMLIGICSIAYTYIIFVKISDVLKNRKPLTVIIIVNYIVKVVCSLAMIFFVLQAVNNFENIKYVFNKSYKNWERLDNFAVIPQSNIPIEVYNDDDYYNNVYLRTQQKMYKEFNKKGAIFANFNEFSPAIRSIRLEETNYYYESDNVFVNPNYLNQYKVYDSEDNEIVISEDDVDQILLVPDKYKEDEKKILGQAESFKEQEFYAIGENQKTKIIWIKSNQKIFTASVDINPDENNEIEDPIIYVLTENNASISDYNYLLGVIGSPFKIKADEGKSVEDTIYEIFAKYDISEYIGIITPVNEQVASSIKNAKENIQNLIIFIILLVAVLIIIIVQNSFNYFEKYKQKLAIEKLTGYKLIDKHKNYFIGIIVSWNLIFSISILVYKAKIVNLAFMILIGFFVEIIFSAIILNIIERKKITGVIKGE